MQSYGLYEHASSITAKYMLNNKLYTVHELHFII